MKDGQSFLLKLKDDDTYTTVAGLNVNTISVERNVLSVSANGIFLGGEAETRVRNHALAGTIPECELSFEDGARWRAKFLIERLDYAGNLNGERKYTINLKGAGKVMPA